MAAEIELKEVVTKGDHLGLLLTVEETSELKRWEEDNKDLLFWDSEWEEGDQEDLQQSLTKVLDVNQSLKNAALSFVVNDRFCKHAIKHLTQWLLERGADPTVGFEFLDSHSNRTYQSASRWAVTRHNQEILKLVLPKTNPQRTGSTIFENGETLLHEAVISSNNLALKGLLEYNHNPNVLDEKRRTPLHWAAIQGNLEAVEMLTETKGTCDQEDIFQNTPLHYAILFGHREVFDHLVPHLKLPFDLPNQDGKTPLHLACNGGGHDVENGSYFALKLIELGCDFYKKDKFGRTPLHEVAYWGSFKAVIDCVYVQQKKNNTEVDSVLLTDEDSQTPMDDYSRNRDTHTWELKKWWIERIACIMNVPVDEVRLLDEDTEEQQQINKGLPQEDETVGEMKDLILRLQRDLARNSKQLYTVPMPSSQMVETLLSGRKKKFKHQALALILDDKLWGFHEFISSVAIELLRRGADPLKAQTQKESKRRPLLHAAVCIDLFFSENLLVRGVQLNKQDEKGKTALMASLKEASMINLLLSYGANPCLQESQNGQTALHMAVNKSNTSAVEVLCRLKKIANFINLKDKKGQTVLHDAIHKDFLQGMKLLLRYGSIAKTVNVAGQTAIDLLQLKEAAIRQKATIQRFFRWLGKLFGLVSPDAGPLNDMIDTLCESVYTKSAASLKEDSGVAMGQWIAEEENCKSGDFPLEKYCEKDIEYGKAIIDESVVEGRFLKCANLDSEYKARKDLGKQTFCSRLCYMLAAIFLYFPLPLGSYKCVTCKKGKDNKDSAGFYRTAFSEEIAEHPAVQTILDYKWKQGNSYHNYMFFIYLLRMVIFTAALLIAARPGLVNPGCYINAWDWVRLAFEIISLYYFVWKFFDEIGEMTWGFNKYFKDYLNLHQLAAIIFPLLIIPFRAATAWCGAPCDSNVGGGSNSTSVLLNVMCVEASSWQWLFATLAYFANAVLIFEYLSVYKYIATYVFTVSTIVRQDVLKFLIYFVVVLYVYLGFFYCALKFGISIQNNGEIVSDQEQSPLDTLYPWHALFLGLRVLLEGSVFNYYGEDEAGTLAGIHWLAVVAYLLFLVFVVIVLLNVLIAQMNKSYEDTTHLSEVRYYQALARTLARINLARGPSKARKYLIMDGERVTDFKKIKDSHTQEHDQHLFNQEMVKISSEVQIKLAEEVEKMKVYLTKEAEKTRDDLISEINEMRRAIEVLTTTVRGSS